MRYLFLLGFILTSLSSYSQKITRQDSLRGSITPQRAWWDLVHYDLSVEVMPESKTIIGTNVMTYKVLNEGTNELQIDLQAPMELTAVMQDGHSLDVRSEGNAHFIQLEDPQREGELKKISLSFEGKPRIAKNPPWDGGITWKKDSNGKHFIASSNQGIGSSVWWPNRDHPADEVDSLDMHVTVPKDLVDVSNGRLVHIDTDATTKTYHWTVKNPINNYGVNLNIGDYVNFSEVYKGEKGPLDMSYWVLKEDEEKAREQFKQAPMMMEAFEHWFGPYPFYEDSFKLVQAPYLGMEHQSSVTYGNRFKNGYLGRDLSGTGEGLKFDFIIIHEAGHEWFANNITNKDVADMWIHEGFTSYSENLYLDYHFGKETAATYTIGTRDKIRNDRPIIGTYNVDKEGSGDMYYKGANILLTLRTIAQDDDLWRATLRGLSKEFYHQTTTTAAVENYIANALNLDLTPFFNQYLREKDIPTFEYKIDKKEMHYRFNNTIQGFTMPLRIKINEEFIWLEPTDIWQCLDIPKGTSTVQIDRNMYVDIRKM
ncbi:M1 family metallopeptidase [Dokdonia donghaensis]|uniref:Peptidase M1 n=1 Tax=Dokdonia donghaensis DSW-1 TaxID=1300343 RepID=A0A0A2GQQ7_9FLAO|nr:M1 family metallopeptidase [Dokdonia donghaensis]ANH61258.1 Peptidase family M1 [Dokdonia donghaensis DSW-1]KGO05542.1 peptidase M1 [Dokdonia donghaensis DSW-1]